MRKVIFAINLTLDGCCDHTKSLGTAEVHNYFTALLHHVDLLVYGRITYELMVPYWPDIANNGVGETKDTINFAQTFTAIDKIVFSRTLDKVKDPNSTLAQGNLNDEIRRLKQLPGKSILLGGINLSSQLIEPNLIDEYHIIIHPIIAGEGKRLFDSVSLKEGLKLNLEESTILKEGYVALRYTS